MKSALYVAVVVLLVGCGSVRAKGDRLVAQGRYDDAIASYDKQARRPLTSGEQSSLNAGRRDAYRQKLAAELEQVTASTEPPSVKREKLAELYALAFSEADAPELGARIETASIEVSRGELDAVGAKIDAGAIEDAMVTLHALTKEIVASEPANQEALKLRRKAAAWLRAKAESEPSDAVKTLLGVWAANLDYSAWPSDARPFFEPAMAVSGTTNLCDRPVPIQSADFGIPTNLALDCQSGVKIEQRTEDYDYSAVEDYVATRRVCEVVRAGYEMRTVQYTRKVYEGVGYQVWESGTKTVRGLPKFEKVCKDVEYIAQREVLRSATRTFDVRRFYVGLKGGITFDLENGAVTKTIDTNRLAYTRSEPVSSDSPDSRFDLDEATALNQFRDDLPELFRRLVVSLAREAMAEDAARELSAVANGDRGEARDVAARQVLYGGPIPSELSDLGFVTGKSTPWFGRIDPEFRVVQQVEYRRERGYASERFDVGASFMEWDFRLRHTQLHELSNQPGRDSVMFEFAQSFSPLAQWALREAWDPYGFVLHDDFGYRVAMGRRVSEAYDYFAIQGRPGVQLERGSANAAGVHAQLLLGYRTRAFGLLLGARGRADTQRVGDVVNGSTGTPLAARLEFRPHPRYPIVLEGWGLSPINDKRAYGANLVFAVGDIVNLAFDADVQYGATRIRGLSPDDLVDIGRRPSYNFGVSLQLAGMFGD